MQATIATIDRTTTWFVRGALVSAALGLAGTGAVLVFDPLDQIGAWLQIGIGLGLAATAVRPSLWSGGLVAAIGTSLGLLVGHLADFYGVADSTIGPVAIGLTVVLSILTIGAGLRLRAAIRSGGRVPTPAAAA